MSDQMETMRLDFSLQVGKLEHGNDSEPPYEDCAGWGRWSALIGWEAQVGILAEYSAIGLYYVN